MKLMDRPTVTEMDRGGVYEMDRQTDLPKKKDIPQKLIKLYQIFLYRYQNVLLHLIYFSGISCFLHFSVYPFQRHILFPFLWRLVCPSISQALPLLPTHYTIHYTTYTIHKSLYSNTTINNKQYRLLYTTYTVHYTLY